MGGRLGFWASSGATAAWTAAAAIFVLLVAVARRRWRLAAARRAEIVRLALLAAEEAARAEIEAEMLSFTAPAEVSGDGVKARVSAAAAVCEVCYCPTTTRCSRCKAVRYCSGKCQIIHWRQGHKDECRPPQLEEYRTGQIKFSRLQDISAEQHDLCSDSVDTFLKSMKGASSESSYSSEGFSSDELVDTSMTESTSDSSSDFSSTSRLTFSGPQGISDDPSSGCHLGSLENHGFPSGSSSQCAEAASAKFTTTYSTDFEEKVHSKAPMDVQYLVPKEPSKDACNGHSAVTRSRVSEFAAAATCTKSKILQKDNCTQLDTESHLQASSMLRDPALSAERICKDEALSSITKLKCRAQSCIPSSDILAVKPEISNHTSKEEYTDQSKNMKLQVSASLEQNSAHGQAYSRQSISLGTSVKVNNAPKETKESYQRTNIDVSFLKPSAHKVVQQLNLSKFRKQNKSGPGDIVYKRPKFLFPYESFVKLYNYEKVEMRPSGLINCGNSCYASAVIQCLAFTPPLTAYLIQGLHSTTCPKREWCFTCELENLLIKVRQGQSPLSPTGILSHIHRIGRHLGHGKEEDAHEFLRYAIDAMQAVCLKEAGPTAVDQWAEVTTLIQLTFGGFLLSKIKCLKCHYKSEQHERMMDLTVEIQGDISTLDEALRRFTTTEILDGDNKYHCDRCKSYERARKKLTIFEAPNILTVALKRFQGGNFGKINKAVRFPLSLDLTPYMSESNDRFALYRLYAVVVHLDVMNAAFSGHYVCYVRNAHGRWYKADDSTVKAVDPERVLSKNAYMLFYARCSPHAPSLASSNLIATRTSEKKEAFSSTYDPEKLRGIQSSHASSPDEPYWTKDNHFNFDVVDGKFPDRDLDLSSDNSSLFGCSDEGSCSTQSTRNSTSTDEFSEYIFGNSDQHKWNSPSRFCNDMDYLSSLPMHLAESSAAGSQASFSGDNNNMHAEASNRRSIRCPVERVSEKTKQQFTRNGGSSSLLYSDSSIQGNKLTEHIRSREAEFTNSSSVKHFPLLRSSTTRERTAQPFY